MQSLPTIAICDYPNAPESYVHFVNTLPAFCKITLKTSQLADCQLILFPGGGDIAPVFYGQYNRQSKNIDTSLDLYQLNALDFALSHHIPILGICKGMQLINTYFGGTLTQHIRNISDHYVQGNDIYHETYLKPDTFLSNICGTKISVNSAHHQKIEKLGNNLEAIQWCSTDNCIEAIYHNTLPILGLQWHPERINTALCPLDSKHLLQGMLRYS